MHYCARSGNGVVTRSVLSKAVALVASSRKKEPACSCEASVPTGQIACSAEHKATECCVTLKACPSEVVSVQFSLV